MTELLHLRTEQRRRFISEAFHSFHQPLTGLHCGLEIALQKPRTDEEYRGRIADALQNASAILKLNAALRQLVDATDPGELRNSRPRNPAESNAGRNDASPRGVADRS
jgi:hypothetical protein